MNQSSQVIWCEFCFGIHHVGYCPEQVSPPLYQPYYPTEEEEERTSRLEDTLVQFMEWSMINQRETEASIKRLQEQMGKLAEMVDEHCRNMVEAQREESDEEEEKLKKERDPTLHLLPIPSSPLEVKHEKEEVSFEDFDKISNHQCNDETINVEHIDFVFGDEHVASNSSKNCKFSFIHMHVNILACELNVGELCWIKKIKKNKTFLMAWKTFERKLDEIQVKRPRKRKGLYYNPCLWSP